ncbi:beta-ketoacyl synthase N-terminal-like domain-containing protein, partial [Streptomyces purpurogeneiscleroticus]|uniref:beta-ketoacyl synthase N-terminal-like domain-containing protein n=1 Tax=Streptomyces purpurogeneiscleroticus TaxID=68259 RepID=UPI0027DEFEE7
MTADSTVVVTGLGLATPAGMGVDATWSRLCDGASTAAPDPELAGLPVSFSCRVEDDTLAAAVGPRLGWRTDRFIRLALAAAHEAVANAALDPSGWDGTRVGVVIGVGGTSHDTTAVFTAVAEGRFKAVTPTAVPRSQPNMAAGEVGTALG